MYELKMKQTSKVKPRQLMKHNITPHHELVLIEKILGSEMNHFVVLDRIQGGELLKQDSKFTNTVII